MPDVALVTCSDWPTGEPGAAALDSALAARGLSSCWVRWDDPTVSWADFGLVAVRSTWDYVDRLEEFLAWARRTEQVAPLLNGSRVFDWNTDKAYLVALAAGGLPVVPTRSVDARADLAAAVASYDGPVVVKPRVGGGGVGVVVLRGTGDLDRVLGAGPWVVQPLIASVRGEGEQSVFVLDGHATCQVSKVATGDEIRVHEEFGGINVPTDLDPSVADLAVACVAAAEELLGVGIPYARVDVLRLPDGRWGVSELEVTEPGLYLDLVPDNAAPFAELCRSVLTIDRT